MNHPIDLYSAAKTNLAMVLGASEDLLHLHAGLLIFFAVALLFRRRMRSPVPVALVWVFAIANEVIDTRARQQRHPVGQLADIANTVFWPTLLFLLARRRSKAGDPNQTA